MAKIKRAALLSADKYAGNYNFHLMTNSPATLDNWLLSLKVNIHACSMAQHYSWAFRKAKGNTSTRKTCAECSLRLYALHLQPRNNLDVHQQGQDKPLPVAFSIGR